MITEVHRKRKLFFLIHFRYICNIAKYIPYFRRTKLLMRDINKITYDIRGAAFKVHTALGPGLLESAYEACLCYELEQMGYKVERQVGLPLIYHSVKMSVGYRIDLLVNEVVIIEIKAVKALTPVDTAQILTYLKLSKKKIGLLMNFHEEHMRNGIKRYIL